MAAVAVSGMPTGSFTFLGFPPTRSKARTQWFDRLGALTGTVILYEAPHRIRRTLEDLLSAVGDCEVVLARELTKSHEELVRGPISEVLNQAFNERGEFVVVLNIGRKPEHDNGRTLEPAELMLEFGVMTNLKALTRRQAIVALAKRYQMAPNDVYQAIEMAKKSGF
jgi:16S rRNA (cytidine1402-2'-O)-methyltransferase